MDNRILTTDTIIFLFESNKIEGVYDADSLMQAVYAWEYLITQPKLTPSVVLKTHKILMRNQSLYPNEKGYFRQCEVSIAGRLGEPWKNVPEKISKWCEDANKDMSAAAVQLAHVEYEVIHPFVDGNGRTGRMFMNYQRIKIGLSPAIFTEEGKGEYYKIFPKHEDKPDLSNI